MRFLYIKKVTSKYWISGPFTYKRWQVSTGYEASVHKKPRVLPTWERWGEGSYTTWKNPSCSRCFCTIVLTSYSVSTDDTNFDFNQRFARSNSILRFPPPDKKIPLSAKFLILPPPLKASWKTLKAASRYWIWDSFT